MAAGLSIEQENLESFTLLLEKAIEFQLGEEAFNNQIITDGELEEQWFNLETASQLSMAGPWGQGFPEPCFDGIFTIINQKIVGIKHLKLVLQTKQGTLVDAIAFNIDAQQWSNPYRQVEVVYRLDVNEFRGEKTLQLMISNIKAIEWLWV